MRRALIAIGIAVVLVVGAVGVAIPILLHRNLSVEAVARRASELSGRPVTVERVGIAFVPALRIRAEGLVVEGAASADVAEVKLSLRPLLSRRVEPAELRLRGARLLLERGPDGGIRLRLLHPPGRATPAGEPPGLPALPALVARDGEIVLVGGDGAPTDGPVLHIRRLAIGRLRPDGPTPVRLVIAVDPGADGRAGVAELEVTGRLERAGDGLALRAGRFEGRDVLARGLRLPELSGRFEYAAGEVAISDASVAGYQGTLAIAGSLRPGRPARYRGRLEVHGADVAAALADWRGQAGADDHGTLAAAGDVDLRLAGSDRGTGAGTFEVRGGTLPAGSLFSALLGGIGALTGNVLSLGRAAAPSHSQVEAVTASWTLRANRFHTDDLVVVTDDYRYDAAGSVGLDRTLALSGTLQLTSRGLQRMMVSAALPLPGGGSVMPAIPLDVGGRIGDARVTARAGTLPSAAKSTLAALVGGGGSVVKGAAEAGGSVVGGAARGGKAIVDKVLGR